MTGVGTRSMFRRLIEKACPMGWAPLTGQALAETSDRSIEETVGPRRRD